MPWASFKYDTDLEGYRVNMTEDQLKGAPRFNRNTDWDWSDRSRTAPSMIITELRPGPVKWLVAFGPSGRSSGGGYSRLSRISQSCRKPD